MEEGYKKTEVGLIPSDWEVKEVEEIAVVKSGKRLPLGNSLTNKVTPHPYIRVADMFKGGVNLSEILYVPEDVFPTIKNYRIFKDEIFISVAGTLGVAGVIPDILDGANLTENANKFTNIKCDRDYLLFVLLSNLIQNRIDAEGTLGAQPKLALTRIRKFQIPLPPTKAEQSLIATSLSDADALISSLEKLITKKRNIKQGAMQKLLQSKEGWEVKKLGDFLDYEQPTNYLVSDTEYNDNNQTPVLTAGKTFILGYTNEEHGIFKNLPVIIFDDFTTAIKYVDFPFKAKSSAMKMLIPKNDKVNLRFVYEIMLQIKYQVADHKRHWIGEFRNIEIIVPPTSKEQDVIATILSDMDNEISALETKLDKYKNIKLGMMQNLLTGKIRLV